MNKLKPTDFVGLKWKNDQGETYISDRDNILTFKISSWVGSMAIGAMHTYADISASRLYATTENGDGRHGGYLGKKCPQEIKQDRGRRRHVKRKLTKVEKDLSGEVLAKVGEWTTRFNDMESAFFAGCKQIHDCFEGNWKVKFEILGYENYEKQYPLKLIKPTKKFLQKVLKDIEFEE